MIDILWYNSVILFGMLCCRSGQEGWLTVDNGQTISNKSPGKLKQLNTNTGLYIGMCKICSKKYNLVLFSLVLIWMMKIIDSFLKWKTFPFKQMLN